MTQGSRNTIIVVPALRRSLNVNVLFHNMFAFDGVYALWDVDARLRVQPEVRLRVRFAIPFPNSRVALLFTPRAFHLMARWPSSLTI